MWRRLTEVGLSSRHEGPVQEPGAAAGGHMPVRRGPRATDTWGSDDSLGFLVPTCGQITRILTRERVW